MQRYWPCPVLCRAGAGHTSTISRHHRKLKRRNKARMCYVLLAVSRCILFFRSLPPYIQPWNVFFWASTTLFHDIIANISLKKPVHPCKTHECNQMIQLSAFMYDVVQSSNSQGIYCWNCNADIPSACFFVIQRHEEDTHKINETTWK